MRVVRLRQTLSRTLWVARQHILVGSHLATLPVSDYRKPLLVLRLSPNLLQVGAKYNISNREGLARVVVPNMIRRNYTPCSLTQNSQAGLVTEHGE